MNDNNSPILVPYAEKLAEALSRMEKMQFNPSLIDKLVQDEEPVYVDSINGTQHDLDEDQLAFIEEFEDDGKNLVYLVIGSMMMGMELESYVFVSDYEDEWEFQHADVDDGYLMTYTRNLVVPALSEYGSIAYKMHPDGFPVRVSTPAMMTIAQGPDGEGDITNVIAMVHSKKEMEMVRMLYQVADNDYIVQTKAGVRCHALFNPYSSIFYADDLYRKVEDSNNEEDSVTSDHTDLEDLLAQPS